MGKTSVSALMVKLLAQGGGLKILAIDADPAIGLATALGVEVQKTVDDIRQDLIDSIKKGNRQDKAQTLNMLDYEIFDALAQDKNLALLAIGRPEAEGCFCKANSLLRDIIQDLSKGFDVVIMDGEAGVEQINRRVMKMVDHLVLVSDTSAKGLNVADTIRHVAHDNMAVDYQSIGLILNRVRHEKEVENILKNISLKLLGWIPEDDLIREYDFEGKPFMDFPDTSPSTKVIADILQALDI